MGGSRPGGSRTGSWRHEATEAPDVMRDEARQPEEIGGLIRALFEKWGIATKVDRARAAAEWDEIVGPRIAEATGNVRVRGRTLFVEVVNASWMSELNMMRHQLLEKVNGDRERGRIEKIVFLQADGPEVTDRTRGREA